MPKESCNVIFTRIVHSPTTFQPMRMEEIIDGAYELSPENYQNQLFLYQNSKKEKVGDTK